MFLTKRFCRAAIFSMIAFLLPCVSAQASGEVYREPFLSGTTETWMYAGDTYDRQSSRNLVFADDLEDGDLTEKIRETYSDLNENVAGDYRISYQVTDSDGNTTDLDTVVHVLERDNNEEKVIRRTLYTMGDASHLTNIGFNRGYYHDRQNLGIWVPAGANLEVRIANADEFGRSLEIGFMNQDSATESKAVIPASGEWTIVGNTYTEQGNDQALSRDSVPFLVTPKCTDVQPIIEYKWNDSLKEIPYYRYKGSEKEFFERWRASRAPYAIIEGASVTFLVPLKDIDEIVDSAYAKNPAYSFRTIDEMLEWYDAFVKQYDAYSGLDYTADEPWNQNVRSKFFIKANEHGYGQAYYAGDHSAYNGDSLNAYLTKDWLSLHEFGHGYEGALATQEHPFVETTNNIMGYYFEPTYRLADDAGWMLGGKPGNTVKEKLAALEQRALQRRTETESFSGIVDGAMHYDVSLYMFTNALDKLGPQNTVAAMHEQYRRYYYEKRQHMSSSDAIVESFSKAGGYNMIPYFATWHIQPSLTAQNRIYDEELPIAYYLKDLIPDAAAAEKVRSELGLAGVYSLVSTDELAYTGYKSQIELKLNIDDLSQIQGRSIEVKNGDKLVSVVPVTSDTIQLELPVGAYELKLPSPRSQEYDYGYVCLIASKGKVTQEILYKHNQGNLLAEDVEIRFFGLGNTLFASAALDTGNQKLIFKTEGATPHGGFGEQVYAGIKVYDASGNVIFSRDFKGNENIKAQRTEISFPVGSKIEITHKEAPSRLCGVSRYTNQKQAEYASDNNNGTVFVMTEYGLMKEGWDIERQKNVYMDLLESYSEYLTENNSSSSLQSEGKLNREKLVLFNAYGKLDADQQEKYAKKWGLLLGMEQASYTVYHKIPSQSLTGYADSESGRGSDGLAGAAVDGDESTYWHSNYSGNNQPDIPNNKNNTYTIVLNENKNIGKLEYVPRPAAGGDNGNILGYKLYYSTTADQDDFEEIPLTSYVWKNDSSHKTAEFYAPNAKRIRICATATAGSAADRHISAAEFYLYESIPKDIHRTAIYLENLHREYEEQERSIPQKGKNALGGPITFKSGDGQKTYGHGLGLMTNTEVVYDLTGKPFGRFTSWVGAETAAGRGMATVQMYGDGQLLYQTSDLSAGTEAEFVNLDISGLTELKIKVSGEKEDMAVSLGDARFYMSENAQSLRLEVGETARAGSNESLFEEETVWESDQESVAVVDKDGNITAVGPGTAVICGTSAEGTVSCSVSVEGAPAVKIQLSQSEISLQMGETAELSAVVMPEFTTDQTLTWSSSNPDIAAVSQDGKVTAQGTGSAVIQASNEASGKKAQCTVTVTARPGLLKPSTEDPKPNPGNLSPVQEDPKPGTETPDPAGSLVKLKKMKLTKVKPSGKKVLIKWKKYKKAEKVEIWMKQGKGKYKKIKTVSAKKTFYKAAKLKAGRKYTFKIRAYVKDSAGGEIYGPFSKTKSIKIKRK